MSVVRPFPLALLAAAALLVTVTGCADNTPKTPSSPAPPASASTSASAGATASTTTSASASVAGVDSAAVALLPADIKSSGTLQVGTNLTYAPDEFKDPAGKPTGWGIALVSAISQRLGLKPEIRDAQFDNIIPGVKGGKYNVGWASFTDTKERETSVDFVDYYSAGTQWASQAGKTVGPDAACGLTVAVGTGTYQETDELPAKSAACVKAGKPGLTLLKLDTQGDITNSVVLGRADAFSADSPVTQYAVKQTGGKLQLAGPISDAAPFGMAVGKTSGTLKESLQKALQSMIDDGSYGKILTEWGVEAGAVTQATINGATG